MSADDISSRPPQDADIASEDLHLAFAPEWARTTPQVSHAGGKNFHDERGDAGHGRYRRAGNRQRDDERGRRPTRPQHRKPGPPEDREAPRARRSRGESGAPGESASNVPSGMQDTRRPPHPSREHENTREFRSLPPLPLEIRVMPEHKALSAIIRRVQSTHLAYPLRDIARLFLDKPEACLVRIALLPEAENTTHLYQCRRCGEPALDREAIEQHFLEEHFDDYYSAIDIPLEPPKGNFNCVARCGITGEILGPPNHHSTNERILQILRERNDGMTEEVYRSRLVMLHDSEAVETWRQQARTRRVYRACSESNDERKVEKKKTSPPPKNKTPDEHVADMSDEADNTPETVNDALPDNAAPSSEESDATTDADRTSGIERQAAEFILMRDVIPEQVATHAHVLVPASVAIRTRSRLLADHLHETAARERRFPAALMYALRGAFRNKRLHMFKANDAHGPDFVMAHVPAPLNPSHAVAEIRLILDYIDQHPGCAIRELLDVVASDVAIDSSPEHLNTQLSWLVEKGHIIEFFNGTLSPPCSHPAFHAHPKQRSTTNASGSGAKPRGDTRHADQD